MKFLQQTPFLRLLLPVVAGILIQQYFELSAFVVAILFAAGLILLVLSQLIRSTLTRHKTGWLFGAGLFPVLFVISYTISLLQSEKSTFTHYDEPGIFLVELKNAPVEKSRSYQCHVEILGFSDSTASVSSAQGNAYLYLQKDSAATALLPGDRMIVSTTFRRPEKNPNPDGFDFQAYLKNQSIGSTAYITAENWQISERNKKFLPQRLATICRNYLLNVYHKHGITGEEFAVLAALTLGYKDDISPDVRAMYSNSGAAHILAVSGLHVGVVYIVMTFLLSFLWKSKWQLILKTILILILLWMYAFITGLSPSVSRAACMFSFVAVGGMFRHNSQIYNTIFMSAFFILLLSPKSLFNIGFQLSYAAVISIVYFQPKISEWFSPKRKIARWAWNLLIVSVTAQIGVTPLVLYYFQSFPNFFLITNLLVVPAASVIIYLAIALFAFSNVPVLSTIIAFLLKNTLSAMNFIVAAIQQLPFSVSRIPLTALQMWLLFLAIACFCAYWHRFTKKYAFLWSGLACVLACLVISCCIQYQTASTHKLLVYSSDKHTHVNLTYGNQNYIYSSNQDELYNIASAYWNNNYLPLPSPIGESAFYKDGFIWLAGKKVFILETNTLPANDKELNVDYLIIGNKLKPNITQIAEQIRPQTVIVDKTISNWYRGQIKTYCNTHNIRYHSVRESGAYVGRIED